MSDNINAVGEKEQHIAASVVPQGRTVVNPPGSPHKDRTGPDQERFKERLRDRLKDKLPDIIKDNPVFDDNGKIKVPVDGGYEPRWRPGRDGDGSGGPGPGDPGEDEADISYIELSYEEFLKLFFDSLNLPYMLKKILSQTEIIAHKRRGINTNGPKARLQKSETAKARVRRAIAIRNAHPEDFIDDFAGKCQAVFQAYLYYAAQNRCEHPFAEPAYQPENIEEFLFEVENAGEDDSSRQPDFRLGILAAAGLYLTENEEGIPYTFNEVVQSCVEEYVRNIVRNSDEIPSVEQVPFHKTDQRFGRIEERPDPDSKAVAFLILDRSGSMSGDPIAIAKAYFLLNIIFLRAKYKNVAIVMIAHDAHAERIKNERDFYQIDAGGGTVAVPAWKMTLDIAAQEFPAASWNRYMFHATDGQLFDGERVIQEWWTKIVEDPFNYCGYLEVITGWGGGSDPNAWDIAGRALLGLKPAIASRVGMARVASIQDLPRAFAEILDKDRKKS